LVGVIQRRWLAQWTFDKLLRRAALHLSRGAQWSLQRAACARQMRHAMTVHTGQAGSLVVRRIAKVKGHRQRPSRNIFLLWTTKCDWCEDSTTVFILLRGSRLQSELK